MYMYITTIQLSTFPTYDRFLLHNTCNKTIAQVCANNLVYTFQKLEEQGG